MRNRFKQWVRRVIMLSFASVGAIASSTASAHDLPIFDTIGLSNCFGINSQNWGFEAGQADLARSFSNPLRDPFAPFQDKSWNWCFAENFSIENTTPQLPDSSRLAPQAPDTLADRADAGLSSQNRGAENHGAENHGTEIIPDWPEDCREFIEASSDELVSDDLGTDDESASKDSYLAILNSSNIKLPTIDLQAAIQQFSQSLQSAAKHISAIEPVVIAGDADIASRNELDHALRSSTSSNYLRSRPLVDDYLDGESFVRDWRSLRPLSGQQLRLDHASTTGRSEELPQAVPAQANRLAEISTTVFAKYEHLQCVWASETHSFDSVRDFAANLATFDLGIGDSTVAAFQRLASMWTIEAVKPNRQPEYLANDAFWGQPLFVIQQLDGKEFLLPAKQARHWNTVPMIDKQAYSAPLAPAANSNSLPQTSSVDSQASFDAIARNLVQSASIKLERLANQLHGIARDLRLSVELDAQVANLGEAEDVR